MSDHRQERCPCEPEMEAALGLMVRGEHSAALRHLDEAVRVCPTNYTAWGNRGNVLTRLGRLADALASYDEALRHAPKYALCWENRGGLLLQLGREDDALASFLSAAAADESLTQCRIFAARILIDRRRFDEACRHLDHVLAKSPKHAWALGKRALALHEKGDRLAAFSSYRAAVDADPTNPEVLNNFGTLCEEMGDATAAAGLYRMALKARPDYSSAAANLRRVQSR